MKKLLIIFGIIFSFSTIQASEVSEWFEKESNQFLEIINNRINVYVDINVSFIKLLISIV